MWWSDIDPGPRASILAGDMIHARYAPLQSGRLPATSPLTPGPDAYIKKSRDSVCGPTLAYGTGSTGPHRRVAAPLPWN